jgi:hypothetical protein
MVLEGTPLSQRDIHSHARLPSAGAQTAKSPVGTRKGDACRTCFEYPYKKS